MPRIMRQAALNIPVLQYDENMMFSAAEKQEQSVDEMKTDIFTNVMIQEAQQKAGKILEHAKEEARQIIAEARTVIFEELEQKKQEVLKEAYDIGFAEGKFSGFELGRAEGREVYEGKLQAAQKELADELEKSLNAVEQYKDTLREKNKQVVIDLVRMISYKILSEKLSQNDELLLRLLDNALKGQERCQNIRIKCSDRYFEILSKYSEDVAQMLSGVSDKITVEEIPELKAGECLVECDDAIIDVSLNVQLDNAAEIIKAQLN